MSPPRTAMRLSSGGNAQAGAGPWRREGLARLSPRDSKTPPKPPGVAAGGAAGWALPGAGSGMGTVPDGAHPPTPLRGSVGTRAHRCGGRGCPDPEASREIKQVEPPLAGAGSAQPSQPCSLVLNSAGAAGQRPCLAGRWLLSRHRSSPAAAERL